MGSPSKSVESKKVTINSTMNNIIRVMRSNACIQWIAVLGIVGVLVIVLLNQQQNQMDSTYRAEGSGRSTQLKQTTTVTHKYIKLPERDTTKELKPIRQISVLGERNSGTRWTVE
jgi:hypothetical protein